MLTLSIAEGHIVLKHGTTLVGKVRISDGHAAERLAAMLRAHRDLVRRGSIVKAQSLKDPKAFGSPLGIVEVTSLISKAIRQAAFDTLLPDTQRSPKTGLPTASRFKGLPKG